MATALYLLRFHEWIASCFLVAGRIISVYVSECCGLRWFSWPSCNIASSHGVSVPELRKLEVLSDVPWRFFFCLCIRQFVLCMGLSSRAVYLGWIGHTYSGFTDSFVIIVRIPHPLLFFPVYLELSPSVRLLSRVFGGLDSSRPVAVAWSDLAYSTGFLLLLLLCEYYRWWCFRENPLWQKPWILHLLGLDCCWAKKNVEPCHFPSGCPHLHKSGPPVGPNSRKWL